MPFTQAILEMAEKEAQGRPIRTIYLRVGVLSAIVPDSVQVFFDYLKLGTLAEGARLDVTLTPIVLTCQSCGRRLELAHQHGTNPRQALAAAFREGCPCGQGQLKLAAGLDFDLAGIEV